MSENGLHKIPVMKQALEAIQELHKSMNRWPDYVLCSECSGGHGDYVAYPCTTRQLADKGLEGDREPEV